MYSIYRAGYGVIFDDRFQALDTDRWLITPSESYELIDGGLRLYHNDTGLTNAFFELPDENELVFEVLADYIPREIGDDGGLVVWKSAMEKLEFLESYDNTQNHFFSRWRVIKKGNLWSFFAYRNGQWELFDSSVCLNPVMAGVVLRGPQREGYVPLDIKRAILCKGTHITVANVNSGFEVSLLDVDGNKVRSQVVPDGFAGVKIDLPSLPFIGSIEVVDREGDSPVVHKSEGNITMYGGDTFLLGTQLKVIWKGKELDPNNPTHLGAMKNFSIEEKMTLLNPSTGNVAENITVRVAVYNEKFGHEWVEVALDNNGSPSSYSKEIYIDRLQSQESQDFWVKVTNVTQEFNSMEPAYFILEITNN